jgi:hypothetical protein
VQTATRPIACCPIAPCAPRGELAAIAAHAAAAGVCAHAPCTQIPRLCCRWLTDSVVVRQPVTPVGAVRLTGVKAVMPG